MKSDKFYIIEEKQIEKKTKKQKRGLSEPPNLFERGGTRKGSQD